MCLFCVVSGVRQHAGQVTTLKDLHNIQNGPASSTQVASLENHLASFHCLVHCGFFIIQWTESWFPITSKLYFSYLLLLNNSNNSLGKWLLTFIIGVPLSLSISLLKILIWKIHIGVTFYHQNVFFVPVLIVCVFYYLPIIK